MVDFILKNLQKIEKCFQDHVKVDVNYIILNIVPEFVFLILALVFDFYIRKRFSKKIKLSEVPLVKDLQIFAFYFLSRTIIILIFSSIYSLVKLSQPIFLVQIATAILIFGFFKFLALVAENVHIEKFGIFLTIVSFIYSFDSQKISNLLVNVKFSSVLFETNLFAISKVLVKLSIFYCIISVNQKVLNFILPRFANKPHTIKLIKTMLTYVLYAFFILNITTGIGIQASHLAMIGSAIGIGIGFGFQKFASNFISGMLIMSENKFRIGDLIVLGDGTWGTIIEIDTRITVIQTISQEKMLIPNETMLNSTIKNLTLDDTRYNIRLDFNVSLNTNIRTAIKATEEVVNNFVQKKYILPSGAKVDSISNSGINIYIRLYFTNINAEGDFDPWAVKSNFLASLQENFKLHNIEFAVYQIKTSSPEVRDL